VPVAAADSEVDSEAVKAVVPAVTSRSH